MEIEEMKTIWDDMSQKIEQQTILTDKLIITMTQERYTNKFNKLLMYEIIGTIICFIMAIYIFLNLDKLDTWYLMTCGIIILIFLIVLPILTLKSISNIKQISLTQSSYKETLLQFYNSKKKLLKTQRLSIYMSFVIAILILPVASKIMNDRDLFMAEHQLELMIFVLILLVYLFFISRWGYKRYKSVTHSAENILKELDH